MKSTPAINGKWILREAFRPSQFIVSRLWMQGKDSITESEKKINKQHKKVT